MVYIFFQVGLLVRVRYVVVVVVGARFCRFYSSARLSISRLVAFLDGVEYITEIGTREDIIVVGANSFVMS